MRLSIWTSLGVSNSILEQLVSCELPKLKGLFFLGGTENPPTQRCRTVKRLVSQIQTHWPTSEKERQARGAGQHREPTWSPPTAQRIWRARHKRLAPPEKQLLTGGTHPEWLTRVWIPQDHQRGEIPSNYRSRQHGSSHQGSKHDRTRLNMSDIDHRQTKLVCESLFFYRFL